MGKFPILQLGSPARCFKDITDAAPDFSEPGRAYDDLIRVLVVGSSLQALAEVEGGGACIVNGVCMTVLDRKYDRGVSVQVS
jgi:hypothetical protein